MGQVATVALPPAVTGLKRAGFGVLIAAQTSSEVENTAGSSVPSIRS